MSLSDWNEEQVVTKVYDSDDVINVECKGSGFGLAKKYGVVPKVGDKIQLKTKNISLIVGVKLNGELVFEKTDAQMDQEREEWKEQDRRQKIENFEKNRAEHDANYQALPEIFQKRIDRLRKINPSFRWDVEPYDVFACREGIKIASVIKTIDDLKKFHEMSYEEQKKLVPIDDGHSGGTFGQAMQIAACLIEGNEKYIPFIHSSLAQIGGCETVGCIPPTEAEKKEYGLFESAS